MSSIITFTYCSKWNHLIYITLTHTHTCGCAHTHKHSLLSFPLYLLLDVVCKCLYVCDMCVYKHIVRVCACVRMRVCACVFFSLSLYAIAVACVFAVTGTGERAAVAGERWWQMVPPANPASPCLGLLAHWVFRPVWSSRPPRPVLSGRQPCQPRLFGLAVVLEWMVWKRAGPSLAQFLRRLPGSACLLPASRVGEF